MRNREYLGAYNSGIISEINPEIDKQAQQNKAERLKESPAVRAVLENIATQPDLKNSTAPLLSKAFDIKYGTIAEIYPASDSFGGSGAGVFESDPVEVERFRNFAPLFSAIRSSERTSQMLDVATDLTIESDSEKFWDEIRGGNNYIREIVIGSGVAAANYLSTKAVFSEKQETLSISKDFGGEFGLAKQPLWKLNSRNRPSNREKSPLPGTEGSLNELGKYATVQPSDYSHDAYQTQLDLGHAVKDNLLLLGNTLSGVEIRSVRRHTNPDKDGILLVEVYNIKTKERAFISTDRIVELAGIGEPVYGLDRDPESFNIVNEELSELEKGGKPKVLHFNYLIQMLSDPERPFPLDGYKDIVIVGDRDSALVALGIITGYEPSPGKTVRQIAQKPNIKIIAPSAAKSRGELLGKLRPRYAPVANEFNREDQSYDYTTSGVRGRARQLRRRGDQIQVVIEERDGGTDIERADLVIFTTGFTEVNNDIYRPLMNESIIDKDEINNRARDIINHPLSVIYYKSGPIDQVEIMNSINTPEGWEIMLQERYRDGRVVDVKRTLPIAIVPEFVGDTDEVDEKTQKALDEQEKAYKAFKGVYFNTDNIIKVEYNSGIAPDDFIITGEDGEGIAKKRDKFPIYRAGAAANLELSRRIRGAAAAIPENAKSIFVTSEAVTELARNLADRDNGKPEKRKGLFSKDFQEEPVELEAVKLTQEITASQISAPEGKKTLPIDINSRDILNVVVPAALGDFKFPTNVRSITLQVEEGMNLTLKSNLSEISASKVLSALLENDTLLELIARLTDYKNNKSKGIEISIPFKEVRVKKPQAVANGKIPSMIEKRIDSGNIELRKLK